MNTDNPQIAISQRVAKNTAALSLTQVARTGFNVIISLVVARHLGVVGLGKYAVLAAYLQIFQVLTTVGVPRLIIREMARQQDDGPSWFRRTLVSQMLGAIGSGVVLVMVANLLNHPADTRQALGIITLSLLPYAFSSAAESAFHAKERMGFIAIAQIGARMVQTVASVLALLAGHGIIALAWTIVVGQCLIAIIEIGVTKRMDIWSDFRVEWRQTAFLFRESFHFFLISLSVVVFTRLDVLILSQMVGEEAVGLYNAAYLIVRVVNFLSVSYSSAAYPALSRLFAKAQADFETFLSKSLLFGTILTLLIAILLAVAAEPIIGLLYAGEEYALAVLLLRVEVPFIIIFMWNALLANGLMASNLESRSVIVSGVKLAAGLVYYLALTSRFQTTGTAAAQLQCWQALPERFRTFFFTRQVYALDVTSLVAKPLAIGAIMVVALWVARRVPWPGLVAGGVILYVSLLVAFRMFSREDLGLFWQMVWPV